jgi:hypothetical protein
MIPEELADLANQLRVEAESSLSGHVPVMLRAADAIEQLSKPGYRWVPVSEKLPQSGQFVAVMTVDDGALGVHYNPQTPSHPWVGNLNDFVPEEVTHWMPLPEPPAAAPAAPKGE